MTLTRCSELSAAGWITASDQPWEQLVTFGPLGFPAYARLRFIPDPAYEGQSENDVDLDDGAPSETALLRAVLEVLTQHTRTPDDCYFCLWDGWGSDAFPPSVLHGPKVAVPNRTYFLFHGATSELGDWGAAEMWPGRPRPGIPDPAFIWPADHAWCIANDIDPHFAGIGADTWAIDQLVADPRLDVLPADPCEDQPCYR